MKKTFVAAFFLGFLVLPEAVLSFGAFISSPYTVFSPIEETAAVFFDSDKKEETIIVSPSFAFNPLQKSDFLWIIAVPSRPTVEVLSSWLLPEIGDLLSLEKGAVDFPLTPVNVRGFAIYEPSQLEEMEQSFETGQFIAPKFLNPILASYRDKGWYFIVARVNILHMVGKAGDFVPLGGSILPLKIIFKTEKPIYPQKLTSTEHDIDSTAVPFSMGYGTAGEVWGVEGGAKEDASVALSEPSIKEYPAMPSSLFQYKTTIMFLSDQPYSLEGVNPSHISKVDFDTLKNSWNNFNLPQGKYIGTFVVNFARVRDLSDVTVVRVGRSNSDSALSAAVATGGGFSEIPFSIPIILTAFSFALAIYLKIKNKVWKRNCILALCIVTIVLLSLDNALTF